MTETPNAMLLIAAHGAPDSPAVCFSFAAILGLVSISFLRGALFPRPDDKAHWGGKKYPPYPMSRLGGAACGMNFLAWSLLTLAEGFRYRPITDRAFWLIGPAFLMLFAAAYRDYRLSKRL